MDEHFSDQEIVAMAMAMTSFIEEYRGACPAEELAFAEALEEKLVQIGRKRLGRPFEEDE